jgi:cytoskeleton-associated protein 5
MQVSNKTKRVEEEKALKTLKWNFDVPRKEFTDQLKAQMETAGFNRTLMTQLFHDDFKYHISALQTLTKAIEDFSDATVSNLDLILRWLTLRFFETNPTVILKAIEYMQALFGMLANVRNYHMIDYEAGAFIPYFIGKLGDPKDPIRKGFRQIIKQISQCYAPVKVFNYLIQGLTSKNSRQRAECLEECGQMIEALGLNSFSPQTSLKEIAKCIGDRDNGVRNAALNSITIAYQIAGEQVYKFIGKLNEKDMAMLEERIKRSSKTTAIKVSASGNLNQVPSTPQMPTSASMSTMANINSRNNLNGNGSAQEDQISSQMNNGGIKMPLPRLNTSPKTQQTHAQLTRPVFTVKPKGEFSLDLKDDEESSENVIPVRLTSHQDLDELLNKPVDLPPPRKNLHAYPINILKESQDCREAIDLVITHISHQKIDVSIQNLVQIDVVIKDKEKRDLLIPHVDTLLYTCALKMNVAHNIFLNNEDTQNSDDVFKLFKGIFSVLIDTFDNQLGKNVTVRTLKEVFFNLLSLMTDQKLLNYNEGEQLIKAINVVTLKLLETSDQTTSYCSLVKLLTECCDQENFANNKYLELLMKCLWRQIRRLSAADVAFVSKIDANQVLSEINTFLKKYPSNSWQAKDSDLPLRTVKTLLYHLSKTRQSTILEHLDEINAAADSEIRTYVMKLFKNNFQLAANGGNATNNSFGGAGLISPNQKLLKQGSPDIKPSSNLNSDQLTAIIKKISNVETSKEGLYELYDLKKLHPDMDLNKYFKNSSGKLQSYIQENLKQIEQERNGNIHRGNNENLSPEYISSSSSALGGNRKIDELMKTINDWKSNRNLNQIDTENVQYETAKKSTFSFSPEKKIVAVESENVIRAERYLDLVQDLKKKYTRSRTEVNILIKKS